MKVNCGKYKHYKGNTYFVFCVAKTEEGEEFVLYREEYGLKNLWIRPASMFFEKIANEADGTTTNRFTSLKKCSQEKAGKELINTLKEKNGIIKNTETKEKYIIASIDTNLMQIIIAPLNIVSAYLTDSQLANRMGYELYLLNGDKVIKKLKQPLFDNEKSLGVFKSKKSSDESHDKEIIRNQFNPCSIDLHISNEFFVSRLKVVDMANSMMYTTCANKFWKPANLKKVNGTEGIVLFPNQTVLTYTNEYISLPSDCAGKIEIKSTYARLSLSITASDFCNPGWKGHFPLAIRNNGKHIIVIHPQEKMAQLSLLPTYAPIINKYSSVGVFMEDEGTPFKFWQSKTVKHIVSESEKNRVLNLFNGALNKIAENSDDIENEKERFQNTFLAYYQKKMNKKKYKSIRNEKEKANKIWMDYKKREQNLKYLFSLPVKVITIIITLLIGIAAFVLERVFSNETISKQGIVCLVIAFCVMCVVQIIVHFKAPKCFCTFERTEFNDVFKE